MNKTTHAFCNNCKSIKPVRHSSLTNPSACGGFIGGDVVCDECHFVVATMYADPMADENRLKVLSAFAEYIRDDSDEGSRYFYMAKAALGEKP